MWLIYPRCCTPISIKIGQHLLKLCKKVFWCVFMHHSVDPLRNNYLTVSSRWHHAPCSLALLRGKAKCSHLLHVNVRNDDGTTYLHTMHAYDRCNKVMNEVSDRTRSVIVCSSKYDAAQMTAADSNSLSCATRRLLLHAYTHVDSPWMLHALNKQTSPRHVMGPSVQPPSVSDGDSKEFENGHPWKMA